MLDMGFLPDVERICRIREQEPRTPSDFVGAMAAERRARVAECRHLEPAKLAGHLRGDLDWIVMKALEKDRARRYDTASGLAADLRRHLASASAAIALFICHRLTARPPSRLMKIRLAASTAPRFFRTNFRIR